MIWSTIGGEQRTAIGAADMLVEDDVTAVADAVRAAFADGLPAEHRSSQVERYQARLAAIDPLQPLDSSALRALWGNDKRVQR
jgi:malonate decarboxylase beta subunit